MTLTVTPHAEDGPAAVRQLIAALSTRDLNEADTRHRIIDVILHDILAWPRGAVSVEEYIRRGYADYVLKRPSGEHLLFLEAKKEGLYFTIPAPRKSDEYASYVSVEKLLTDENTRTAMKQVREYCLGSGPIKGIHMATTF